MKEDIFVNDRVEYKLFVKLCVKNQGDYNNWF